MLQVERHLAQVAALYSGFYSEFSAEYATKHGVPSEVPSPRAVRDGPCGSSGRPKTEDVLAELRDTYARDSKLFLCW